jgi:hypothetical protein
MIPPIRVDLPTRKSALKERARLEGIVRGIAGGVDPSVENVDE